MHCLSMMIQGLQCSCRNNKNTRSSFEIAEFPPWAAEWCTHEDGVCDVAALFVCGMYGTFDLLDVFGATGMYIGEQIDAKKMELPVEGAR